MRNAAGKDHPASENARRPRFKVFPQFLCVETDRRLLVEFERDGAAGIEIVFLEIVQEKLPLVHSPHCCYAAAKRRGRPLEKARSRLVRFRVAPAATLPLGVL